MSYGAFDTKVFNTSTIVTRASVSKTTNDNDSDTETSDVEVTDGEGFDMMTSDSESIASDASYPRKISKKTINKRRRARRTAKENISLPIECPYKHHLKMREKLMTNFDPNRKIIRKQYPDEAYNIVPELGTTKSGRPMLIAEGLFFCFERIQVDGVDVWLCRKYKSEKCKAKAYTKIINHELRCRLGVIHNHDLTEEMIAAAALRAPPPKITRSKRTRTPPPPKRTQLVGETAIETYRKLREQGLKIIQRKRKTTQAYIVKTYPDEAYNKVGILSSSSSGKCYPKLIVDNHTFLFAKSNTVGLTFRCTTNYNITRIACKVLVYTKIIDNEIKCRIVNEHTHDLLPTKETE